MMRENLLLTYSITLVSTLIDNFYSKIMITGVNLCDSDFVIIMSVKEIQWVKSFVERRE